MTKTDLPPDRAEEMERAAGEVGRSFFVVRSGDSIAIRDAAPEGDFLAYVPAVPLERLGDASFLADHRVRYPIVSGAMANGIASEAIVEEMARAGALGFFGAAGLPAPRVEAAVDRLHGSLGRPDAGGLPHGFNLIHSPNEPGLEEAVADLYIRRGVRLVEASAYLDLSLAILKYRLHGIARDGEGRIATPNRVVGKVSRVEVARRFFSPAPEKKLRALVERGDLTAAQAELAERVPVASDLTAEADSGGHTDNQPFAILLPTLLALRDEIRAERGYDEPLRVGVGGGIGAPEAVAAAFAMGAAYVVTGSVNQACVESGTSDRVREMLAQARQADCAMAPAADMFEMGVKLQVLKRGTMFPMRAAKLHELYRAHDRWEDVPATARAAVEKDLFRATFDEIWERTKAFFAERDPSRIGEGERDPKKRMALVFRWYLGLSSHWANAGDATRQADYQIWCGPAMGAFNDWTRGTFLENVAERRVATVSLNLLYGGAYLARVQALRMQGIPIPAAMARPRPLPREEIERRLRV